MSPNYLCEGCFTRKGPEEHRKDLLVKEYKHCILDSIITTKKSAALCQCADVSKFDSFGSDADLYPIPKAAEHRLSTEPHHSKCRLCQLPNLVREMKASELRKPLEHRKRLAKMTEGAAKRMRRIQATNRHFGPTRGLQQRFKEPVMSTMKRISPVYPFGNAHVALQIGPLIIENGIPHSKRGVLISYRAPIQLSLFPADELLDCYALSNKRKIFTQQRVGKRVRRLKACMKQVVGDVFCGLVDQDQERSIIEDLVMLGKVEPQGQEALQEHISAATARLFDRIKPLLEPRIQKYLLTITARLFDQNISLTWSRIRNNCQNFIDGILPYEEFGRLFPDPSDGAKPQYLISFAVPSGAYHYASTASKHDVPNGLVEEYILGFHSGRHDDADFTDTLQAYWTDWGAFRSHLYPHQDVFPWDCTQAYNTNSATCGSCSLAEHVWAFPFDSFSAIQLHLQKGREFYCPVPGSTAGRLSNREWMENRFKIMLAQHALVRGAAAMANTTSLVASLDTQWKRTKSDPRLARLKLGGIHRGQPYSHKFELGSFTYNYLAPWVHLPLADRQTAYEKLRTERQQKSDVKKTPPTVDPNESVQFLSKAFTILVLWAVAYGPVFLMLVNATKNWHAVKNIPELKAAPYASLRVMRGQYMSYITSILFLVFLILVELWNVSIIFSGEGGINMWAPVFVGVIFASIANLSYQSKYIPSHGLHACRASATTPMSDGSPSIFTVIASQRNSTAEQVCSKFLMEYAARIFITIWYFPLLGQFAQAAYGVIWVIAVYLVIIVAVYLFVAAKFFIFTPVLMGYSVLFKLKQRRKARLASQKEFELTKMEAWSTSDSQVVVRNTDTRLEHPERVHYIDLKQEREGPLAEAHARQSSCMNGSKRDCWACRSQICDGCATSRSLKDPETTRHLNECQQICTNCFFWHRFRSNHAFKDNGKSCLHRQPGKNRTRDRAICASCATLPDDSMVLERRQEKELRELESQEIGNSTCWMCKTGIWAWSPRWKICSSCGQSCLSELHPSR